jgi:hypothetical protein
VIQNNDILVALGVYEGCFITRSKAQSKQLSTGGLIVPVYFASWVLDKLDKRAGELDRSFWEFGRIYGYI